MFSIRHRTGVALVLVSAIANSSASTALATASSPVVRPVVRVALNATETVDDETFRYDGTCVGGPGLSTGGPGSKITYAFSLQGTATSSTATDPAITTAASCDVHYLAGGAIKEFGRTLPGSNSFWADTVEIDPTDPIEICVTVGGDFFNGHSGSRTQCTVPWTTSAPIHACTGMSLYLYRNDASSRFYGHGSASCVDGEGHAVVVALDASDVALSDDSVCVNDLSGVLMLTPPGSPAESHPFVLDLAALGMVVGDADQAYGYGTLQIDNAPATESGAQIDAFGTFQTGEPCVGGGDEISSLRVGASALAWP
jgi:hypothetical protein